LDQISFNPIKGKGKKGEKSYKKGKKGGRATRKTEEKKVQEKVLWGRRGGGSKEELKENIRGYCTTW
jgi:hypothetical protein